MTQAAKEPIEFPGPDDRLVTTAEIAAKTGAAQGTVSRWPEYYPEFPRFYRIGRLKKARAGALNKYFSENA
jgi:hypothetical protein